MTKIKLILLLILLVSCEKIEPVDKYPCYWFSRPPDYIEVSDLSIDAVDRERLKDEPLKPVLLRVGGGKSGQALGSVLQELSLYRVHVSIELQSGNVVHYGYPLSDGHARHPWYSVFQDAKSIEKSVFAVDLNHNFFSRGGIKIGIDQLRGEIEKFAANEDAVFVLNLGQETNCADIDSFFQILWELRIKRYLISN